VAVADFTEDEIEAGRRLFAADWRFAAAAGSADALPAMVGAKVAFAGRSNVGKSSLINALTGRKALARTSHTPGRTQELIFFAGPPHLTVVDMPGYGYAAAPKTKVKAWTELIHAYLRGRANLARVYVLIDARHGLKPPDLAVLESLDEAAVSYQIVLTKADQVRAGLAATITSLGASIARRPAAFPDIIATSARAGTGIPQLRAAVARVLRERKV
jgi:GTP-binding protein